MVLHVADMKGNTFIIIAENVVLYDLLVLCVRIIK